MLADAFLEMKEWRKAEALYKDAIQLKKQAKPIKKCRYSLFISVKFYLTN